MAAPGIPSNVIIQQGNAQVLVSWDLMAGATSYIVFRSTDNVTFAQVGTPTGNQYLDTTVTAGTHYYYYIQSTSSGGTSSNSSTVDIIPTNVGTMSLAGLRQMAQQRADRENSSFVGTAEWNRYINQAAFELYDLLTNTYEDYYTLAPVSFTTDGVTFQYNLNTILGSPTFYKLVGVDAGVTTGNQGWVTLKKFNMIARNQFVYPTLNSNVLGFFDMRYRLVGNTLMFIPTPSAGQTLRIWYIPRMSQLLQDTDILDGVNGWDEYVVVDAAIRALQKEESDVSVLMAQKLDLRARIEESAANRDAGQPETISDVRSFSQRWGQYGGPNSDGSFGGY